MKNSLLKVTLVMAIISVTGLSSYAQYRASKDKPVKEGPKKKSPQAIPIDGGISLLLAAGAAFGAGQIVYKEKTGISLIIRLECNKYYKPMVMLPAFLFAID